MAGRRKKGSEEPTRAEVAEKLLKVYDRCMQEEAAKDGGSKVDAKGALQALEQLTRLLGLAAAKEPEEGGEVTIRLADLGDAE